MSDGPVDAQSALVGGVVAGGVALLWRLIGGSFSRNVNTNDAALASAQAEAKKASDLAESADRAASAIATALGEIKSDLKSALSELRAVHDEQIRQVATLEVMRERLTRVESAAQAAHRRLDDMGSKA